MDDALPMRKVQRRAGLLQNVLGFFQAERASTLFEHLLERAAAEEGHHQKDNAAINAQFAHMDK